MGSGTLSLEVVGWSGRHLDVASGWRSFFNRGFSEALFVTFVI